MNKYFITFTEERTEAYGYYVEADTKEQAFEVAHKRYHDFQNADAHTLLDAHTVDNQIEEV